MGVSKRCTDEVATDEEGQLALKMQDFKGFVA